MNAARLPVNAGLLRQTLQELLRGGFHLRVIAACGEAELGCGAGLIPFVRKGGAQFVVSA